MLEENVERTRRRTQARIVFGTVGGLGIAALVTLGVLKAQLGTSDIRLGGGSARGETAQQGTFNYAVDEVALEGTRDRGVTGVLDRLKLMFGGSTVPTPAPLARADVAQNDRPASTDGIHFASVTTKAPAAWTTSDVGERGATTAAANDEMLPQPRVLTARSAQTRAAKASDHNERLVKRASFRSCWEKEAPTAGKVVVKLTVDPAGHVSTRPVVTGHVSNAVVSCVVSKVRAMPFKAPPNATAPTAFEVSSSYSPQGR